MTQNTSPRAARRQLFSVIEDALADVGRRRFTRRPFARRCRDRLVHWFDEPIALTVDTDRLTYDYSPYRETVREVEFGGVTLDLRNPSESDVSLLAEYPRALDGIETAVADLWADTFETECPYAAELGQATRALADAITELRATATLDEVVRAIRNDREEIVELLFDVDTPIAEQEDAELAAVFDRPLGTVPYRDDDLALLVPEHRLETTWRGGIVSMRPRPREAFVVGRDDTPAGFFVHPIDGTHVTATSTVTREDIRDAMGFDRELSPEASVAEPAPNERVRVQGDLCLERTRTGRDLRQWLAARYREDVERAVTAEYGDRFLRRRNLADYRDRIQTAGRGPDVSIDIERSELGAEAVAAIERRFVATRGRQPRRRSVRPGRYRRAEDRLERRLSNYFAANEDEYAETVARRVSNRVRDDLDACGQLNLPIDNHLVVVGNARLHPDEAAEREPVRIVVPDRTSLHVVHDEHPQVDVALGPGAYSLRLLDRGIRSEAERPSW